MFPAPLLEEAHRLLAAYRARGFKIATAESCTGGLIAGALTEITGASDVVTCGFVPYSNAAKEAVLGVPHHVLVADGAVSASVARAMAAGALARGSADVAVATTGIAGPGGGSADKPVGLIYLAVAVRGGPARDLECRFGNLGRAAVRLKAVEAAFSLLWQAIGAPP